MKMGRSFGYAPAGRAAQRRAGAWLRPLGLSAALVCAACATAPGQVSPGFVNERVAASYHPLWGRNFLLLGHWGAGITVAPHIAATNAHNGNLLPAELVLAQSQSYDLLFYRTENIHPVPAGQVSAGAEVIAYGQGRNGELREARGKIANVSAQVPNRCDGCPWQHVISFDAEAGPGFSGGPLVDAKTGTVIGLVFGYRDGEGEGGGRRMYAYDIALVMAEMQRLLPPGTR